MRRAPVVEAGVMLTVVSPVDSPVILRTSPAHAGVVSWNGIDGADEYALDLCVHFTDGGTSAWMPYVEASAGRRRSCSARDGRVSLDVDVLACSVSYRAVEVRFRGTLDALALATPEHARHPLRHPRATAVDLAVPMSSQYVSGYTEQRGWCSPASLGMLLAYHGVAPPSVDRIATSVFDTAYGGAGNWAFNVAYAGGRGLRGIVVYLRDLEHARAFIDAGLPLAISYAWSGDELPAAPLEHSTGHLAVLRGFAEDGDPILNDPAQPGVRAVYPRAALEFIWLRAGGVAYAIAPRERTSELTALANA